MVYFNLEMVFGKQYIWKKIDIERAVQYIRQVQQKYPDIHFANTENKSTYLDINTDGVCSDNSLVFHNKSLQKEMKQVFDSKIEEYLNKR